MSDKNVEEARAKQAEMIAVVRERGFKNGAKSFSDAQVWQAIIDSRDWGGHYWDNAAGKLLEHVIEGRMIPASPTIKKPS